MTKLAATPSGGGDTNVAHRKTSSGNLLSSTRSDPGFTYLISLDCLELKDPVLDYSLPSPTF